MRPSIFLLLLLVSTIAFEIPGFGKQTISVVAEETDYNEVPVTALVPNPGKTSGVIVLKTSKGELVPCQSEVVPEGLRITWIVRNLKKGERRTYTVVQVDDRFAVPGKLVRLRDTEGSVAVLIGGSLFTSYIYTGAPKPYCYPIIGPSGGRVTRNYPMQVVPGETTDHPHHRSFWFAHGDVNGVDFWSEKPEAGKIVHRKFEALESGPVFAKICSLNDWVGPDGKKVCEDKRELRFYNTSSGRLMDFEITIRATEGPVKFGDTKEGTMGIRVASSMDVDKGQGHILSSRGEKDGSTWGKQAEWCDYYGPVNAKTVGIAVFDHSSSFRHPTYWHVRTYGLFAANPFGLHDFKNDKKLDGSHTIPAGGEITFRYRIFIHKGDPDSAGVAAAYSAYANPPKIEVGE